MMTEKKRTVKNVSVNRVTDVVHVSLRATEKSRKYLKRNPKMFRQNNSSK